MNYAHLDIKIDNILLDDEVNIKIADFGFSLPNHNEIYVTKGSAFYRSPEIVKH